MEGLIPAELSFFFGSVLLSANCITSCLASISMFVFFEILCVRRVLLCHPDWPPAFDSPALLLNPGMTILHYCYLLLVLFFISLTK